MLHLPSSACMDTGIASCSGIQTKSRVDCWLGCWAWDVLAVLSRKVTLEGGLTRSSSYQDTEVVSELFVLVLHYPIPDSLQENLWEARRCQIQFYPSPFLWHMFLLQAQLASCWPPILGLSPCPLLWAYNPQMWCKETIISKLCTDM